MYVDMNSYFASCEQQLNPALRGVPIGVVTYDGPHACVIAPSAEAKQRGVKTGMRLSECRAICPEIKPINSQPHHYRRIHVEIMKILKNYCAEDVIAKSIDEAVINLVPYRLLYKDMQALARQIKADITAKYDYLKCSIGIAPNSFLAKLATELQKPDGLVQITHENIDTHLANLKLTDLPGIASRNDRRLRMIGINNPLEMRHASPALLRKAFGGIVGNYWHSRLNFGEVDIYYNEFRTMSATRTVSRQQSASRQSLLSLMVSLCNRLELRMVKTGVFCKEASFFIRYRDRTSWDTQVKFAQPVQDGTELRQYLLHNMEAFEQSRGHELLNPNVLGLGVAIQDFISDKVMQYSLFDNRIKHDILRKALYNIKDKYGKNVVRKAAELYEPDIMKDAIGFGSVKDIDDRTTDINEFALEAGY